MKQICVIFTSLFMVNVYIGDTQFYLFIDVNECKTGEAKCDANAICINFEGGFACKCRKGYQGSGFVCTGRFWQTYYTFILVSSYFNILRYIIVYFAMQCSDNIIFLLF